MELQLLRLKRESWQQITWYTFLLFNSVNAVLLCIPMDFCLRDGIKVRWGLCILESDYWNSDTEEQSTYSHEQDIWFCRDANRSDQYPLVQIYSF